MDFKRPKDTPTTQSCRRSAILAAETIDKSHRPLFKICIPYLTWPSSFSFAGDSPVHGKDVVRPSDMAEPFNHASLIYESRLSVSCQA